MTYPSETAFRVVLLLIFKRIVDQGKSAAETTSELGLEAKHSDPVGSALQLLGNLVSDLALGNVCHAWVEHLHGLLRNEM